MNLKLFSEVVSNIDILGVEVASSLMLTSANDLFKISSYLVSLLCSKLTVQVFILKIFYITVSFT